MTTTVLAQSDIQLHIWGGGKGIGKWLAEHLVAKVPVQTYDLRYGKPYLPNEVRRSIVTQDDEGGMHFPNEEDLARLRESDRAVHVIATPHDSIAPVTSLLTRELPPECCIAIAHSVQGLGIEAALSSAPPREDRAPVVGLHPLFGHNVSDPAGQRITLSVGED
jgi:prephenate dehydrogenase